MSMKIQSTAVFDVETKTIGNPYELELSSISIIFSDDGLFRYYTGENDELREGVRLLLTAERICGFNSRRFDVPVILKYMTRGEGRKLRAMPHLDFFREYQRQRPGQRISLDNMSKSTIDPHLKKFELTNNTAIGLYKTDPEKLMAYNNWDTRVTYWLLLALYKDGYVRFTAPTLTKLYIPNWSPLN